MPFSYIGYYPKNMDVKSYSIIISYFRSKIRTMLIGLYRHYKGGLYLVTSIARHTEAFESLVIYHSISDHTFKAWARPLDMFTGMVEHNGKSVKRFTFLSNPSKRAPSCK